jgi:hypothetical protein
MRIEAIIAEGGVQAIARNSNGEDQLEADRVGTELYPVSNQPRLVVATGKVTVRSNRPGAVRNLETSMLRLEFTPPANGAARVKHAVTSASAVEFQDSGTVSGKSVRELMRLSAQHLEADFNGGNDLRDLRGSGSVHLERQMEGASTQTTNSREMVAQFEPAADGRLWTRQATFSCIKILKLPRPSERILNGAVIRRCSRGQWS